MTVDGAVVQVAATARSLASVRASWTAAWPLGLPCGLLIAGGLISYPASLDQPVALERLLGLILACALSAAASIGLRRVANTHGPLVGMVVLAFAGAAWVIAASGPDVFRGTVGAVLDAVFRPVFGLVQVTDPVSVSNTRFIIGYNGLADLCLIAIFCAGAVLLERPGRRISIVPAGAIAVSLVLLVGTGARGGLTGLAAGICTAGLYAWPRRYAVLALIGAPAALAVAAFGILDKGLEFSSTAGRLTYWADLARLLVEYPFTGVGLGVDTAYRASVDYQINPDPERVFYAHNTFVQSYLEMGPLGALGMVLVPIVALGAILVARRNGSVRTRQPLIVAGLGIVGGLEAHGLTDQVVTTNTGTAFVLLATAALLAGLNDEALRALARWARRGSAALGLALAVVVVGVLVTPGGRAQALLDLGGLAMNRAFDVPPGSTAHAAALDDAEAVLLTALGQDPTHAAVLRDLARVRSARFDDAGGLDAIKRAATACHLDAFDMLQIAHVYRDLGFAQEAYAWAARAYEAWGRAPEDSVMQSYAQRTLNDNSARVLAEQAEAAMIARHFGEAHSLFEQALAFEPASAYLQDRIGASQRAIDKYGA